MDRKFIAIMGGMLLLCLYIISGATGYTSPEEGTASNSLSTASIDTILDKDKVIDINISLDESDFQDMLKNPLKEEYKVASVVIAGQKIDNVGLRTKGNSTLTMVANSESDRYSFKLDFDQYIDGQNLAGLKKLNLNNSMSDPSYMREYLSYSLMNEMGVPTPGYGYVNVYINDKLHGLYLAVEGIEEPFLERYYGSNAGTLYKPEGQGSDLVYTDDKRESYSGIALVAGRKNGANEALLTMVKALNQGKDLEKYLNIDEILRYFAVNTVLVNMDSYQGSFKHNYYLYEESSVFSILPWDYNMSFGGFSMGRNNQETTALYIDQPVSGTTLEQRPLIGKLLEVKEYKELYHQYIEDFINGPFAFTKMEAEIARVAELIRPHLKKDPTKFYTMEQFEQAILEGSTEQKSELTANQTNPPADQQAAPPMPEKDKMAGQQQRGPMKPGGDMLQGGNVVGLVKFVRERIANVTKQVSGELPSVGKTTEQTNTMPGQLRDRPEGQGGMGMKGERPPGDMGQRPPNSGDPVNREMGDGFGNKNMPTNNSTEQLFVIGGSLLLLVLVLFFIFTRKTKYSL